MATLHDTRPNRKQWHALRTFSSDPRMTREHLIALIDALDCGVGWADCGPVPGCEQATADLFAWGVFHVLADLRDR